jgi:hypothetical protein
MRDYGFLAIEGEKGKSHIPPQGETILGLSLFG